VANRIKAAMSRQGTPVSTVTAEEISQRISGVLGGIQMTLAAIAAISLLVGAVGVMNTMYTSVLERTREIGISQSDRRQGRAHLEPLLDRVGSDRIFGWCDRGCSAGSG
jgi:hypothetical protein